MATLAHTAGVPDDRMDSIKLWAGRALSGLPAVMLILSASMKLSHSPQLMEQFVEKFGYPASSLTALALVELACAILFLVPRTAVLGAVLITGYLGGATATHVRVGDPFIIPVLLGAMAWGGLYFRDARVRALLPLRTR